MITTARGTLQAVDENGMASVNMGQPQLDWADVPLARAMDTLMLPVEGAPTATGMGNPHATFFVDVWERGVGVTLASGSSSCATAVAAFRRESQARHPQAAPRAS